MGGPSKGLRDRHLRAQMNSQIKSNTRTKVMSDTPKNQPKSSAKSPHPFVSDEKIKAHYYTDCRACKNETKWRADVTGALCTVCYTFVPRDSIGGAPPEELDDKPSAEFLDDAEVQKIILAATKVRPHMADEIAALLHWATMARLNASLLDMVLEGRILPRWSLEGVKFSACVNPQATNEPVPVSVPDSQASDPPEKPVKPPTERKPIARILDLLDVNTKEDPINDDSDRALWCLLASWEDRLPPMDANFQGRFRRESVTGNGSADMAIWYLIQHSNRFWRIFNAVCDATRC